VDDRSSQLPVPLLDDRLGNHHLRHDLDQRHRSKAQVCSEIEATNTHKDGLGVLRSAEIVDKDWLATVPATNLQLRNKSVQEKEHSEGSMAAVSATAGHKAKGRTIQNILVALFLVVDCRRLDSSTKPVQKEEG